MEEILSRLEKGTSTRDDYLQALDRLDSAVCEALAVGQEQAGRLVSPCIGMATYVHSRLCAHGVAAIRAVPLTRWIRSDHQIWNFSVLAVHARSILEGYLYFSYLMQPTNDELDESRARITLLQLNDCCSRMKFLDPDSVELEFYTEEANKLRDRLKGIPFFQQLPVAVRETCLAGKKAWFMDRAQLVALVGMKKRHFDVWWNLLSQHSHIHPISFYRNEANGRGSGLECDPDRAYLGFAMLLTALALEESTSKLVEFFPDVTWTRKGVNSKFSPGPKANRKR